MKWKIHRPTKANSGGIHLSARWIFGILCRHRAYWTEIDWSWNIFKRAEKRQSVKAFECTLPRFLFYHQFSLIVMMLECRQFSISKSSFSFMVEEIEDYSDWWEINTIWGYLMRFLCYKHFNEKKFNRAFCTYFIRSSTDWYTESLCE